MSEYFYVMDFFSTGLWNKTAEVAIKTFHAGPIHDKELPKEVQVMRKLHDKRLLKFFAVV